jgi:hypothetical protein
MLRIRPEQFAAFDADIRSRYHRSLLEYYRDTIPEAVARFDDATLLARIAAADERGRRWGIALQDAMAQFIGLDLVIGEQFDAPQDVRRYFEAPGMSMDMKVYVLADLVQKQLRKVSG